MQKEKTYTVEVPLTAPPGHVRKAVLTVSYSIARKMACVTAAVLTTIPTPEGLCGEPYVHTLPVMNEAAAKPMNTRNNKVMMLMAEQYKLDIKSKDGPGWTYLQACCADAKCEVA